MTENDGLLQFISIFLTHFLNIEFLEECAFDGQWFLGGGMATLFVISVYHIFCSLVKEED